MQALESGEPKIKSLPLHLLYVGPGASCLNPPVPKHLYLYKLDINISTFIFKVYDELFEKGASARHFREEENTEQS